MRFFKLMDFLFWRNSLRLAFGRRMFSGVWLRPRTCSDLGPQKLLVICYAHFGRIKLPRECAAVLWLGRSILVKRCKADTCATFCSHHTMMSQMRITVLWCCMSKPEADFDIGTVQCVRISQNWIKSYQHLNGTTSSLTIITLRYFELLRIYYIVPAYSIIRYQWSASDSISRYHNVLPHAMCRNCLPFARLSRWAKFQSDGQWWCHWLLMAGTLGGLRSSLVG